MIKSLIIAVHTALMFFNHLGGDVDSIEEYIEFNLCDDIHGYREWVSESPTMSEVDIKIIFEETDVLLNKYCSPSIS